jgi:hypothetical protein
MHITHTQSFVHVLLACLWSPAHIHIHTQIHTHIHTYTSTHIYIHTCVHMHSPVYVSLVCEVGQVYVENVVLRGPPVVCDMTNVNVCVCVCADVCAYVQMFVCVCADGNE